jgi:uncharacterized OB-fold protein
VNNEPTTAGDDSAIVPDDAALLIHFPGVLIDHVNKHFYRGMLRRELLINRCRVCGLWHHRPKPICPRCWSRELTPTRVDGSGAIYLLSRLYQGPPADGVDYTRPYPVVAVDLDEQPGLRFTAALRGDGMDTARIGDRVSLDWVVREGRPHPVFLVSTVEPGDER